MKSVRNIICKGTQLSTRLALLLVFLSGNLSLHAQGRKDLETRRLTLQKEISRTGEMLKKTQANKSATFEHFITLRKRIQTRKSIISTLKQEIFLNEQNTSRTADVVLSMEDDVKRLQLEHGQALRRTYRQILMQGEWMFVLSATSFNDAFRRWQFIKQYDNYRNRQGELILETQNMLKAKLVSLSQKTNDQQQLLDTLSGQMSTLDQEILEKDRLLKSLSENEKSLTKDLQKQENDNERLNNSIQSIILKEQEERRKASRKRISKVASTGSSTSTRSNKSEKNTSNEASTTVAAPKAEASPSANNLVEISAEDAAIEELSREFAKNKGRLRAPVAGGVIVKKFGQQAHATIPGVQIYNNGIDIRLSNDKSARSIFAGKVTGVKWLQGARYCVIVDHGNYFAVYSNLASASVQQGDRINTQDVLGEVHTDPNTQVTDLHFELWYGKSKINPTSWIRL